MVDKDVWRLRATIWELLAFSLRYPSMELAGAVASGEWAESAQEVADSLGLGFTEEGSLDRMLESDVVDLLRSLRIEATRLFIGAKEPAVSPYEGVWRAEQDGVHPLLFVNPHSMKVERFCKACGLTRPEGTNEPLDHAATECEVLMYLASLEGGIFALSDGVVAGAMPGGSPSAAYKAFLRDHIGAWMPQFAERLAEEARHPFYKVVGKLLRGVAADKSNCIG